MKSLSLKGLALASARHPWRTIGAWIATVVVAFVAIAALLGGALTTEGNPTNNPESERAADVERDAFFSNGAAAVTDIVVVRSDAYTVDAPQFRAVVRGLANDARQADGVDAVRTYLDTRDPSLVSRHRHATMVRR
jgi:uncharacterized membrane protein YdfJ with MMPL/SSD domain